MNSIQQWTFEQYEEIAQFIYKKTNISKFDLGIVCGSGFQHLAELVQNPQTILFQDIPSFPLVTVKGHKGEFVVGQHGKYGIILMAGRFHCYEGHSAQTAAMPIRVFKALKVKSLLLTNASGAINPDYKVGEIMLLNDHLNLCAMVGQNPLFGQNDPRFGERFFSTANIYDQKLANTFKRLNSKSDKPLVLREGVYCMTMGPHYESPAEKRAFRILGADVVGMSTLHEVMVAAQTNIKLIALSLVTDDGQANLKHEQVLQVVQEKCVYIKQIIVKMLEEGIFEY